MVVPQDPATPYPTTNQTVDMENMENCLNKYADSGISNPDLVVNLNMLAQEQSVTLIKRHISQSHNFLCRRILPVLHRILKVVYEMRMSARFKG